MSRTFIFRVLCEWQDELSTLEIVYREESPLPSPPALYSIGIFGDTEIIFFGFGKTGHKYIQIRRREYLNRRRVGGVSLMRICLSTSSVELCLSRVWGSVVNGIVWSLVATSAVQQRFGLSGHA